MYLGNEFEQVDGPKLRNQMILTLELINNCDDSHTMK